MIKKLQEEWEKLSQEAQAGGNDPSRQNAIVERMNAVSGALRKLSQGSVTRTTLSQAVRESLDRILSESKDSLFPDLARQSEVDRGLSLLEERLKEIEASLGRRLESLESRIDRELGAGGGQNGGALHGVSRQILEEARAFSALDLIAALDAHNRVSRSVGTFFAGYDLLITPTLGQLPAPHGTLRYDDADHTVTSWLQSLFDYGPFTVVFNMSGQPAVSLPLGHSETGLPIGVQLVAAYGREDVLLRAAAQLERAIPWKDRTPRSFHGTH